MWRFIVIKPITLYKIKNTVIFPFNYEITDPIKQQKADITFGKSLIDFYNCIRNCVVHQLDIKPAVRVTIFINYVHRNK